MCKSHPAPASAKGPSLASAKGCESRFARVDSPDDLPDSPAFTTVAAPRQALLGTDLPSPQQHQQHQHQQQPASPAKTLWPQPVKDYVSRAFMTNNIVPGIAKEDVGTKLKQIITEAAENGLLSLIDWPSHPLPQQILARERSIKAQHSTRHPIITDVTMNNYSSTEYSSQASGRSLLKRKSLDAPAKDTVPPWRQSAFSLAERVTTTKKADKRQKLLHTSAVAATSPLSKFADLEKRRQRFESNNTSSLPNSAFPDHRDGPVVGTCQKIEKNYFRLTAPPVPETVRPPSVLAHTLDFLIAKWKDEHNYGYICDQFKSLRQDLTVQHIKSAFTVRVYEAHARIALEKGDLGEYNQCQTQLRALYKQNLPGCSGEFLAYRVLYFIHTCNRSNMGDLLANLTLTDKQTPAVHHALSVRKALASGNYHKFFRLYDDPPNMGGYLMDMFVDRERLTALSSICRAYKPDVKVLFVSSELSFADDQQCAQFICDYGGEQLLEHRDDGVRFLSGKAGQVFEQARQKAFGRVDIKGQI